MPAASSTSIGRSPGLSPSPTPSRPPPPPRNSAAPTVTAAKSSAATSSSSSSSSLPSSRRVMPPPPVTAPPSLPFPRVSLSDRSVLRDVSYISDWLVSVEQSSQLSSFAGVISKVKRTIFTPQQVLRTQSHKQTQMHTQAQAQTQVQTPLGSKQPIHSARHRLAPKAGAKLRGVQEHRREEEHQHSPAAATGTAAAAWTSPSLRSLPSSSAPSVARAGAVLASPSSLGSSVLYSASSTPSTAASTSSASSPETTSSRTLGEGRGRHGGGGGGVRGGEEKDGEEGEEREGEEEEEEEMEELEGLDALDEGRLQQLQRLGLVEPAPDDLDRGRAHRITHSIAPAGVEFVQGRWVSVPTSEARTEQPSDSRPASLSPPSSYSPPLPFTGPSTGAAKASSLAAPPAFPDDLDDLPDWDVAETQGVSDSRPSSASASLNARWPPSSPSDSASDSAAADVGSEGAALDAAQGIAEAFSATAELERCRAASPISAAPSSPSSTLPPPHSRSPSPLLAAKMAQFPDDFIVRELQALEDEEEQQAEREEEQQQLQHQTQEGGEGGHKDAGEAVERKGKEVQQGEDASLRSPSVDVHPAPLLSPPPSASAPAASPAREGRAAVVANRLQDRLLRVSMGGGEAAFPDDIDQLVGDGDDGHSSATATAVQLHLQAEAEAAHTAPSWAVPSATPPPTLTLNAVSTSPSAPPLSPLPVSPTSSAVPSTPSSASSNSASLAPGAPSSRVLNEFDLSPDLVAALHAMEAEHRPCNAAAAQDTERHNQRQPLTRSLQLTWLIRQADMLSSIFHLPPHPSPSSPCASQPRSSPARPATRPSSVQCPAAGLAPSRTHLAHSASSSASSSTPLSSSAAGPSSTSTSASTSSSSSPRPLSSTSSAPKRDGWTAGFTGSNHTRTAAATQPMRR